MYKRQNEKQAIEGISTNERIEQDVESTAVGARSDIWKCAINNIKDFNIKQLIIGGGGSYSNDIYMNNSEYTNKLIKIYENDKDKVSKLDPHNFILNDLLEGGIVKAVLILMIAVNVFIALIKDIRREVCISLLLMIIFMILTLSLLVSAHYCIMWGLSLIHISAMLSHLLRKS